MRKLNKKQKLIILTAIVIILVIISLIIGANIIKTNIINSSYNSANNNSSSGNLLPEYIKEGITLGGITGTLVDLDTSDATATEWDITYGETAYVKGKKITGLFVPRDSLKIGDYVDYTPDTASAYSLPNTVSGCSSNQTINQEKSLTWQILSINDNGTIDLISSNQTTQRVKLKGALGYNNGVYLLHDICKKQYSNNSLGTTARSINMEYIESKMNSQGREKLASSIHIGTNIQYSPNNYYPKVYEREIYSGTNGTIRYDGIDENDSYYTSPTNESYTTSSRGLLGTNTLAITGSETVNYFDNATFYNLIFNGTFAWIASRYVTNGDTGDGIGFGIRVTMNSGLNGGYLYNSWNYSEEQVPALRPIVTLNGNITLYGGDGTEEHPYKLKL